MSRDQVTRSLQWSRWPVNASAELAVRGPAWLPFSVRKLPLRFFAFLVNVQVGAIAYTVGIWD